MKFNYLALGLLLFAFTTVSAQEYLRMIDDGTYRVSEIVEEAEAYFADKDKGRGSGYVQFKRWEYMAMRLQDENGYLPSIEQRIAQQQAYDQFLNETAGSRLPLNDNWQELGPVDWNATSGWNPGVGRITGFSVDANDNDHIIAGANTGGVWKSTDGGATWTPLNDYFSNLYVYSVTIDPNDSDTYYFGSYSGIIFKSTDAGGTWTQIADLSNSLINKILIHPTNPDLIFASSQNAGIYRTTDGGANWTQVISGNGYDVVFKPGDTQVVYAGSQAVWRSTDGGASFDLITGFNSGAKMFGVSADDPEVVYVLDADQNEFGDLYKSTDSGQTYTSLGHTNRNYFGYDTAGFDSGGQAPRDMAIAVNPTDVNEVHIAGVLTWRSLDGGVTMLCTSDWIPGAAASANIGYCHADVNILEFVGTTLFAGTDGGLFKATDTDNLNANYYEDLTTGMGIRQFYKIGISQTNDVIVTGGSQDNGTSFYTQANGWRDWLGADGMEGFVDKDNTNIMYGTTQYGRLYRTVNGGTSYAGLQEPGPGSGNWVSPFEQDPQAPNTIYVGYTSVYKSQNSGSSWTTISQNFGNDLDNMKIAPSDNNIIFAEVNGLVYRTADGGATTWDQVTSPGGFVNSIAIHPTDPDKIAVAVTTGAKVRISEDGGQSWSTLNANLPNFSALALTWDENPENGLYLGMDYGIYYIDDTFSEWQPFSTNLPNVIINELEINQADGMIYAGSYGRGLWVSPKYDATLAVQSFAANSGLAIYPNPAEDYFIIGMEEAGEMDIKVFDLNGRLVIYQPDQQTNGRHSVDVSALNPGMYFVRIGTAQGQFTERLLVK